jgi:hypothetical protein
MLGEHPYVVDEVGEEGGHDSPIAGRPPPGLMSQVRVIAGRSGRPVRERCPAVRAEPGVPRPRRAAYRTAHDRGLRLRRW